MKTIFALALLLSLSAGAAEISFDCSNKENQKLQLTVNEDNLLADMDAPALADVQFSFDGKTYYWKQNQYLSFPISGNTVTLFKMDAVNSVYIEYSKDSGEAFVGISIEGSDTSFECKRN